MFVVDDRFGLGLEATTRLSALLESVSGHVWSNFADSLEHVRERRVGGSIVVRELYGRANAWADGFIALRGGDDPHAGSVTDLRQWADRIAGADLWTALAAIDAMQGWLDTACELATRPHAGGGPGLWHEGSVLRQCIREYAGYAREHLRTLFPGERPSQRTSPSSDRAMTSVVGVLRGQRNRLEHCDYDLSLEHVALILSGREVRFELSELARRAGARMLKMAVAADMTWAWIGYPPGTAQRQLAGLTRLLESAAESTAIGEPTVGIAGFRLSHEQAAQAAHFQREGARVTRYGDIALLTVLDSDKVKQAAFVRYELAQLAEAGHRLEVLRETLRVYLQNGQNITATQAVCGISRGTVRRRLAAVEETLGRTIMTHAASLLVALTLVDTGCLDEGGG